jgi:chemotaxis protein methyltransferase CheR
MAASQATCTPLDIAWNDVKLGPRDFDLLSNFIQTEVGIQVPPAKRILLESRLRKRLRALGLSKFRDYTDQVFGPNRDESEIVHLIDAITTNKTDFFREPHHFDYLVRTAVPQLIEHGEIGSTRALRVWSAASSTGEEPYTLAMVLSEFAEKRPINWTVIGTDISTAVLDRAKRAIYSESSAEPIPPILKYKYLLRSRDRQKGLVRVIPGLRQKVTLQRLNLLSRHYDIPRPIDVIFCRNVFIYFNRKTQQEILLRFVDLLQPRGFVFLGHSETINGLTVPLVQIAPTVYQKER